MYDTADNIPGRAFGAGHLGTWMADGVFVDNNATANCRPSVSVGSWTAHCLVRFDIPYTDAANHDAFAVIDRSVLALWNIHFVSAELDIKVFRPITGTLLATVSAADVFDGATHHVGFRAIQDGADVDWSLIIDGTARASGTEAGLTNMNADSLSFSQIAFFGSDNSRGSAVGHMVLFAADGAPLVELYDAMFGHPGEPAGRRIERLCAEEGIEFSYLGDLDETAPMGPQPQLPLVDVLRECELADGGTLFESRGALGLTYRTLSSLYNQSPAVTLDYSAGQLAPPLHPSGDDQNTRNDITAKRKEGAEYRAVQESGPLNVNDPGADPDGVGRYDQGVTVNVESDDQLPDIASWLRHLGTVKEERYPRVKVELAAPAVDNNLSLELAVLAVDIDDRIVIQNLAAADVYEDVDQVARGYTEVVDTKRRHTTVFNTAPASAYNVWELEDADFGRLDSEGSVLAAAIDSDDTALSVATTSGPLWTTAAGDLPMPMTIRGERISVTDIDNEVITFVGVGTAAHADNASINPGLPTGHAAGNLLLLLTAIRSSGSGTANTPTGYTLLWEMEPGPVSPLSNVRLFGKIDNGSESAPTVTWFGGSAGDTCSGQMAAFAGKWYDLVNGGSVIMPARSAILNPSAQNVAYPALYMSPIWANCLIVYIGWKQDDWTSVSGPGTELGEPSSTLGNDQGLTWAYQIQTTAADIAAGSFTVTGGASAISKGGVVAIRCDRQAFTVTRNVNQLPGGKAHPAGSSADLAQPVVLAL